MEYYKIIKLSTGDDLVCTLENPDVDLTKNKTICVSNPVVLNVMRMPRGEMLVESYVMIPWVSFAENETYEIPTRQILTTANIKDKLKENYLEFVRRRTEDADSNDDEEQEVDPEDELYDELIGQLAEDLGDESEEDERNYSDRRVGRNTRTIH